MKAVLQRVTDAQVRVQGTVTGEIKKGFLIFLGVEEGDSQRDAFCLAEKITGLRIFTDSEGKMNLSLREIGGSLLVVSNFTLYADCRKGKRPSFTKAEKPQTAEKLYEYFLQITAEKGIEVQKGIFGADMQVSLVNDGPVTLILDSKEIMK